MRISEVAGELVLDITDYGRYQPAHIGSAQGAAGMHDRASELVGEIHWDEGGEGGTKVLLRFPLPPG